MDNDSMTGSADFQRFAIKGIDVTAIDVSHASDLIGELAVTAPGEYVTVTGAHGIVESVYDEAVREAHRQAFMVVPDGMPLVWLGQLLGFNSVGRVYGPELMECIFAKEKCRKLRHFFYGASPLVVSKLRNILASRFGEFNWVGAYSPPMRPAGFVEDEEIIRRIRDSKPHIVWVGLSTPKQELWLQMHMRKIGSGVGIGVGAAFDLLSGSTIQAPRWVQRSGFEWLFRLAIEPRRLYRRYVFVVPRFFYFFLQTLISRRRHAWRSDQPKAT